MELRQKLIDLAPTLAGPYMVDGLPNHKELSELKIVFFNYCLNFIINSMEQFENELGVSESFVSFYEHLLDDGDNRANHFIRSSLGHPFKNIFSDSRKERLNAVIEISLQFSFSASKGSFHFNLESPISFFVLGEVYKTSQTVTCNIHNENSITMTFDDRSVSFVRDTTCDTWMREGEHRYITICGKKILIIPVNELNKDYYLYENETCFIEDEDRMLQELQKAANYLESFSPRYAHWVANILNEIVVIDKLEGMTINRSSSNMPCSILLSFPPAEPDDFPQIFVHECTHNYMHLLSNLESLVTGEDKALYYSSIKKTERPLEAILATYHAFSNVIFFLKECVTNGAPNEKYNIMGVKEYQDVIGPLVPYLSETKGLTEYGQFFWRKLAQKMGHIPT